MTGEEIPLYATNLFQFQRRTHPPEAGCLPDQEAVEHWCKFTIHVEGEHGYFNPLHLPMNRLLERYDVLYRASREMERNWKTGVPYKRGKRKHTKAEGIS